MKKFKKVNIIPVACVLFILFGAVLFGIFYLSSDTQKNKDTVSKEAKKQNNEKDNNNDISAKTIPDEVNNIINQGEGTKIKLKQDGSEVSGQGATVSGNKITIKKSGNYSISGKISEGQIYVDAGGDDTVVLSLCGADITNKSDAAIHIENAGYTAVFLKENTKNCIKSGVEVDIDKMQETAEKEQTGGALYSRDDLAVSGDGELSVLGYINNGIHTTNNLVIDSGNITVQAVNNGIKGKDSVSLNGGKIFVKSVGDGIKSNDTTGEGYGFISVTSGDFTIESKNDAIQAETVLKISGGNFNISSGGGSKDVKFSSDNGWGMADSGWDMEEENKESTKGLKSGTRTIISGGVFDVDSMDDAFHSNGSVEITGGKITAASGDDGIHADNELTIEDGVIKITRSYEGLEGNQILVKGGEISVVASDDGMNAYGGSNSRGPGGSQNTTAETPNLNITGGKIYVNADGDGLDSNGNLTVEGGVIVVDGPSGNGNGALDSGSENGGKCTVNGGTVLAVGSSGMAETFDSTSKQYSFCHNFTSEFSKGDKIVISDKDGKELYSYTAVKSGSSVIFSSGKLSKGETYTLRVGDMSEEITLDNISTTSGESTGNRPGHPGGQDHMGGKHNGEGGKGGLFMH